MFKWFVVWTWRVLTRATEGFMALAQWVGRKFGEALPIILFGGFFFGILFAILSQGTTQEFHLQFGMLVGVFALGLFAVKLIHHFATRSIKRTFKRD